jgi:predicted metal-dependent hydrolase
MAPPYVLAYLVSREVVHLLVPDHSKKFWLMLQAVCPDAERARQWLATNGAYLQIDLDGHVAFAERRQAA